MPVIERSGRRLDYLESGEGPRLVLVHSSVSGARQWRPVMKAFAAKFHCLAPNLMGYAKTSPAASRPVTLDDHVDTIMPILEPGEPFVLVGHSFGGMVAAKAAERLGNSVSKLLLIEPNPFNLLRDGDTEPLAGKLESVFARIREAGEGDDWLMAAENFVRYWEGDEAWNSMDQHHRIAFSWTLPPLLHEWEAVFPADAGALFEAIRVPTDVIYAADTNPVIAALIPKIQRLMPDWHYEVLPEGGHMFPKTRPDLMIDLLENRLPHAIG